MLQYKLYWPLNCIYGGLCGEKILIKFRYIIENSWHWELKGITQRFKNQVKLISCTPETNVIPCVRSTQKTNKNNITQKTSPQISFLVGKIGLVM